MSVISTGNNPKLLWPGLHALWGRDYKKHKPEWSQIFAELDSDKNYEEEVEMTGFGLAPVKAQGASVSYDSETQGPTTRYTHVVYGNGFIVTQEEFEDNLYEKAGTARTEALMFGVQQTIEVIHANILNRAFNSSYTGGDGLELCSTAHVTVDGTQSNELTDAADLSEASLEDLLIQVMTAENSRGHKINLIGQKLIVPPALFFDAKRILDSDLTPDSANNAANIVGGMFPGGLMVNHYLTDTDAFFVQTNAPRGLQSFWRRKPAITRDNDFDTENLKVKVVFRCTPGWTEWRQIFGSPGA